MSATLHLEKGDFRFCGTAATRSQPEEEWKHRLRTREHLTYLQSINLFDVTKDEWAKATVDGEAVYGHEFVTADGKTSLLTVRLRTSDGKLSLSHNEGGPLDRHLLAASGQRVVYSITSSNNGLESTHTLPALTMGLTSVAIIVGCLSMTVALASASAAAAAAVAAGGAVATFCGVAVTVYPAVGIVLAVLALIGLWIAWGVGREIMLNITWQNRSKKKIELVDHYAYNIGDNKYQIPATLEPLHSDPPFEFYDGVVVNIDNYSKFRGVGISMKFKKDDGTFLTICLRNDIYKSGAYSIGVLSKDDKTTPEDVYNACTQGVNPKEFNQDFKWGTDLVVKNRLDASGLEQYNLAGILSFNDA